MQSERHDAERLNAAIDALRSGVPPDEVAADLPPELRPMLRAGLRLAEDGRARGEAVSAAYVLGLEEQLRTDLRLRGGAGPRRPAWPARRLVGILIAGVLVGALLLGGAERAQPGDTLYPLKRRIEAVRADLTPGGEARSSAYARNGLRRLAEVKVWVHDGRPADLAFRAVLDDLVAAYETALSLAAGSDDPRTEVRMRVAARAAAGELEQLGGTSSALHERWIEAARRSLARVVSSEPVAEEPGSAEKVEWPAVVLPGDALTPTLPATAAVPTLPPTATGPPAPIVTPTVWADPPSATPTPRAPTRTPTPVPPRPTREKPDPSPTPPAPTATPSDVPGPVATPTGDAWPTDLPSPPATGKPPDDATVVPTEPSPTAPPGSDRPGSGAPPAPRP